MNTCSWPFKFLQTAAMSLTLYSKNISIITHKKTRFSAGLFKSIQSITDEPTPQSFQLLLQQTQLYKSHQYLELHL